MEASSETATPCQSENGLSPAQQPAAGRSFSGRSPVIQPGALDDSNFPSLGSSLPSKVRQRDPWPLNCADRSGQEKAHAKGFSLPQKSVCVQEGFFGFLETKLIVLKHMPYFSRPQSRENMYHCGQKGPVESSVPALGSQELCCTETCVSHQPFITDALESFQFDGEVFAGSTAGKRSDEDGDAICLSTELCSLGAEPHGGSPPPSHCSNCRPVPGEGLQVPCNFRAPTQ